MDVFKHQNRQEKENNMKNHTIQIPFEGFYNSIISSHIDDYIEQLFEDENDNLCDVPEEFDFTMNHDMKNAICEHYVQLFQEYLKDECNINISLKYIEYASPREYNFATDKIYCEINSFDVAKLSVTASEETLEKVIKARHSSYSGFISAYSNNLHDWNMKNAMDYDEIELHTILIAAMLSNNDDSLNDHFELNTPYFWDDSISNGVLDELIFSNMSEENQKIANDWHEENR